MQVKFNKQQLEAINTLEGAVAVIAGAGSGKSTVLVNRIKNMVDNNINQDKILAITFTKNTSKDLKQKLHRLDLDNIHVGTFHSICSKILIEEGYNLSKNNRIRDFEIENLFKKLNGGNRVDYKDIISFISYQKNYMRNYNDNFVYKESEYLESDLRIFYKEYEIYKQKKNWVDFDDLLLICLKVLNQNKNKYNFDYILVDEHQDSNLIQNELIKLLCPSKNIFCVFDYRQAIYTFRGGNPEYCMNFKHEYPNAQIINLNTNYRSCANIVNNANKFIKKYYGDYEYYSDSNASLLQNGNIQIYNNEKQEDEAVKIVNEIEKKIKEGENLEDIAILYRLNSHSIHIEHELKRRDIPYYIDNNGSFFKRKEIECILSCLRLVENPHDDGAVDMLLRYRPYPFTYIRNSTKENIRKLSAMNGLSLFQSFTLVNSSKKWELNNLKEFENIINRLNLQYKKEQNLKMLVDNIIKLLKLEDYIKNNYTNQEEIIDRLNSLNSFKSFIKGDNLSNFITYVYSDEDNNKKAKQKEDKVQMMSIHKSKGLEFKNVFIVGIEDGKFPNKKTNLIEEARLFYVGVTRPKENLYLSQINQGNKFIEEYVS
ncbi:ATP-dependent DNA helicase PcrA [Clostridium haemolyticum]|uniref:ATP-dependent helicase n=1 Tax=Clostridium haemolyticum TaxID=84025 RepID=UPI001C3B284C|nr:ATP-dependent helicase [Clostridium haemolyticum]CAG7839927.1 ATP-dependent DNA helicase PcrA [Clostridium haemolyticum]